MSSRPHHPRRISETKLTKPTNKSENPTKIQKNSQKEKESKNLKNQKIKKIKKSKNQKNRRRRRSRKRRPPASECKAVKGHACEVASSHKKVKPKERNPPKSFENSFKIALEILEILQIRCEIL